VDFKLNMSVAAYHTPKYRVGNSSRTLGDSTNDPEGFIVLNLSTLQCFQVSGGVWINFGLVPLALVTVWNLPASLANLSWSGITESQWANMTSDQWSSIKE
jgi:hypothetical protein